LFSVKATATPPAKSKFIDVIYRFKIPLCHNCLLNNTKDDLFLEKKNIETISAISWWSVLLVEETGEPGENHRSVGSH
jgi:hypothetical protein